MEVCILILQYNSSDFTLQLLESIVNYEQNNIDCYRFVVMDNASDEPQEDIITSRFPFVEFIQYSENLGFARAHNQIINDIDQKWLLLLNNDCMLKNNAIYKLLKSASKINADFATCEVFNEDGTMQNNYSYLPSPLKRVFIGFTGIWRIIRPLLCKKNTLKVGYINGSVLLIKNDIFRSIGMFDGKYFMYCEDLDLMLRLSLSGYKGYRIRGGKIIHFGGASAERINIGWQDYEKNKHDWVDVYGNYYPSWQIFFFLLAHIIVGSILQFSSKTWSYRNKRAFLSFKRLFR